MTTDYDYDAMRPAQISKALSEMNLSKASRDLKMSRYALISYAKGKGNPKWETLVRITKYIRGELP